MADFNEAVRKTLGVEGGYSNRKSDRGGKTNLGITQGLLLEAISRGVVPPMRIEDLTEPQAVKIYRFFFWDELGLDGMDSQIVAEEIFDTAVNMGPTSAVRILQRALRLGDYTHRVVVDGILGPKTLERVNEVTCSSKDEDTLFKALNVLQGARYIEICERYPDQIENLRGWLDKRVVMKPERRQG